jgi:hypothetical protein
MDDQASSKRRASSIEENGYAAEWQMIASGLSV